MLPTTASVRSVRSKQKTADSDIREAELHALKHGLSYLLCILYRDLMACTEKRTLLEGITASQWRFLRTLYIEDGITQRNLSTRIGLREPTTVRALKTLETKGLVLRHSDAEDRRKINVYLTLKARNLVSRLIPMVYDVNQTTLAGFSEREEQTFKKLLIRAIHNLRD